MRILFLSEGNPETRDSWSGISKSVVDSLRAAGHEVVPGDVELYSWRRWLAAISSITWPKARWRWRYRLGAIPFYLRSSRATAHVLRHGPDAVIQIGATFRPAFRVHVPWFLYCDSNIRMSKAARLSGHSEAASLTHVEIDEIADREAAVYHTVDGIFTLSERARQSFLEDFRLGSDRVRTVHGGPNFDPRSFTKTPRTRPIDRPPTVLFVGRAFERKGGDLLLTAFQIVRARVPDARLEIVGPPRPLADQPGVVWRGFLNADLPEDRRRLAQAYAEADVFCLPTRFEPFGIVFLEAMFAGLPCVGTDVWAVREMIVDGETGWLIPLDDAPALADRLESLLRNTDLARKMGEAGRERAIQHFTWELVIGRILAVMEPMMDRRRP